MASVRHELLFIEADSFLSLEIIRQCCCCCCLKHYLIVEFVSENTGGIGAVVLLWESAALEPVSSSLRIRGSGLGVLGASVSEGWMVPPSHLPLT